MLSGCSWAVVYNFSPNERNITLTKDFSNRLISSCWEEHGNGTARTFCVLDKINGVCRTFPNKGIVEADCAVLSSYGYWDSMDNAIEHVIEGDDCLSFFENQNPDYKFWGSVFKGFAGCK
jgi:hypothetical protein